MDFVGSFPGFRIFAHVSLEATTFTVVRGDANNAGMAAVGYKLPAPHQMAEDFITPDPDSPRRTCKIHPRVKGLLFTDDYRRDDELERFPLAVAESLKKRVQEGELSPRGCRQMGSPTASTSILKSLLSRQRSKRG